MVRGYRYNFLAAGVLALGLFVQSYGHVAFADNGFPKKLGRWANKPTKTDKDGDAIADSLETRVYRVGDVEFSLDSARKDLVVILFYYGSQGLNRPCDDVVRLLMDMYAEAPVIGTDADHQGVRLTLIIPNRGIWFEGESNDDREIGEMSPDGEYDWNEYDQLKAATIVALGAESLPTFYHACLSCNAMGGGGGSSGLSRNADSPYSAFRRGAMDFIASVYSYQSDPQRAVMVAGTIAHECGHNLGLTHGGFDHINYKPNYLSIMNYMFQFDGLLYRSQIRIDYQNGSLYAVKERSVNEAEGLGCAAIDYATQAYANGALSSYPDCNRNVDWNNNGVIDIKPYKMFLTEESMSNGKYRVLKSEDNWANVNFTGGGVVPKAGTTAASPASPVKAQSFAADDNGVVVQKVEAPDYAERYTSNG